MIVQDTTDTEAKFKCDDCNLQFGTPRDLSRHLHKTARHGGDPCPCAICHKPLTRPDSRARHERRCRERYGVTEDMWRGIERERQRGRRKSISIQGVDEGQSFSAVGESTDEGPSMSSSAISHEQRRTGPSRSRTVSISEVSDAAELTTAFASARVAPSAPPRHSISATTSPRFVAQPSEPASWTRARSASMLVVRPPPPPPAPAFNGRARPHDPSSLPSRNAFPQPSPSHAYRRPLNYRDSIDPPSSPRGMQDESDSEPIAHVGGPYGTRMAPQHLPRWTTLSGEDDQEVDELAGDDDYGSWDSPARAHGHGHGHVHGSQRIPETTMPPPPKKKLFGFESQGSGNPGWSSHMSKTPR
jgi:hypothetical protein